MNYRRGPRQKVYDGESYGLCPAARYILLEQFPELQNIARPEKIFSELKQKAQDLTPGIDSNSSDGNAAFKASAQKTKVSKDLFVPLQPKRNFEEVAQQIKDLIFAGKLRPMETLPSEREPYPADRKGPDVDYGRPIPLQP